MGNDNKTQQARANARSMVAHGNPKPVGALARNPNLWNPLAGQRPVQPGGQRDRFANTLNAARQRLLAGRTSPTGGTPSMGTPGGATSTSSFQNQYNQAMQSQMADYNRIMGGYQDWRTNQIQPLLDSMSAREPTQFSFREINPVRSPETEQAMAGYREFSETGGYSPQDIQELRARGVSPIRAAYGNSVREIDRARSLSGGYAPNYIAARGRMQRELPGQIADATTTVNAQLADAIRSGRLSGLAGLGGLADSEAGRGMQADLANQGADLQAQGMTEDAYGAYINRLMAGQGLFGQSLDAERGLFGTTPGMANMFGNQLMQMMQMEQNERLSREQMRQQNTQFNQTLDANKTPWWQQALGVAGTVAPILTGIFGNRNRGSGGSGNLPNTGAGGQTPVGNAGRNSGFGGISFGFNPGGANIGFGNIPSYTPQQFGGRGGISFNPQAFNTGNVIAGGQPIPAEQVGQIITITPEWLAEQAKAGRRPPLQPGRYRINQDGSLTRVG